LENFWERIFGCSQDRTIHLEMRLLTKNGKPLLLLPRSRRAAAATFDLYPAQTAKARILRKMLRSAVAIGLPGVGQTVRVNVSRQDEFLNFLRSTGSLAGEQPPIFGILAGNPASASQRFMILVFDGGGNPVAVVKTGTSEEARELIQKEGAFLTSVAGDKPAVPALRGYFHNQRLDALVLDFYPGDSPAEREHESKPGAGGAIVPELLSAWLNPQRSLALKTMKAWEDLERAAPPEDIAAAGCGKIRETFVRACLQHGDFAPWNIKVSPAGVCTVLDWERGEVEGIPGWDWFHYYLQSAILVEKLAGPRLVERAGGIIGSTTFQSYAQQANIQGIERPLMAAYLLHVVHVIQPSEGRQIADRLRRALSKP
jgi:hypothetical protein